jgi:predicted transcriptional regulator of viral defense system
MKQSLGPTETQALAYLQMRRRRTVRTGELVDPLRLTRTQERELLHRLARGRQIARVRRGLYLVPARLPLGGAWTPDETLALNTLMRDAGARYQICGPSAFSRYGLDNQVPARIYAYNDRISGRRAVGSVELTLIKVSDDRLGGTEKVKTAEGEVAVYASRARTLVDATYDWSRFNSLPRAYAWIRDELASGRVGGEELVRLTLRYADIGTTRRLGALLERLGVRESLLRKLERRLRPTTSPIPWVPSRPRRGSSARRWGVVLNESA